MTRRRLSDRIAREGLLALGMGGRMGGRDSLQPGVPERHERSKVAPDTASPSAEPSQGVLGPIFDAMTEAELQQHVIGALTARGWLVWHVVDSRLMRAGLPDIVAIHPTRRPRRVLFWELKDAKRGVTPEQRKALTALADVDGAWTEVIRPATWPAVLEALDAGMS